MPSWISTGAAAALTPPAIPPASPLSPRHLRACVIHNSYAAKGCARAVRARRRARSARAAGPKAPGGPGGRQVATARRRAAAVTAGPDAGATAGSELMESRGDAIPGLAPLGVAPGVTQLAAVQVSVPPRRGGARGGARGPRAQAPGNEGVARQHSRRLGGRTRPGAVTDLKHPAQGWEPGWESPPRAPPKCASRCLALQFLAILTDLRPSLPSLATPSGTSSTPPAAASAPIARTPQVQEARKPMSGRVAPGARREAGGLGPPGGGADGGLAGIGQAPARTRGVAPPSQLTPAACNLAPSLQAAAWARPRRPRS
jgi:hypothetical protein